MGFCRCTDALVVEREKEGSTNEDSELNTMILAKQSGKLDDTELRFMLMTFLLAGYDTSKNMLTMMMHTLLQHPEVYSRCAEDKAYCQQVINEMMRYHSIATPFRQVAKAFDYDGVHFAEGSMLALAYPLSGRDPAAFPEAEVFNPDRASDNRGVERVARL